LLREAAKWLVLKSARAAPCGLDIGVRIARLLNRKYTQ
jgi:hypothetical protein